MDNADKTGIAILAAGTIVIAGYGTAILNSKIGANRRMKKAQQQIRDYSFLLNAQTTQEA